MYRIDFSQLFPSWATKAALSLQLCIGVVGCTDSPKSRIEEPTVSKETVSQQIESEAGGMAADDKVEGETRTTLPNISEDAFLQAALDGDASIVKRGLRQGIRVDFAAEDKRTALMLAAFNGHASIVKHLLEHKATVDLRDTIQRTALMYASTGTSVETVELLLDAGANVNAADAEESWTPLMMAAAEGQAGIVAVLLKHGANVASKDVDGETALQFAASKGHQAVVDLLSK